MKIAAGKILTGQTFRRVGYSTIFTRRQFERSMTQVYRCVKNIVATSDDLAVWCIPCDELVELI